MVYSNAARCLIKLLLKSIGSKVQTSDYNNKTSLSFNTIRCLHCHHSSNETTTCTLQHAVIKGLLIKYPQHLMLLICHFFHSALETTWLLFAWNLGPLVLKLFEVYKWSSSWHSQCHLFKWSLELLGCSVSLRFFDSDRNSCEHCMWYHELLAPLQLHCFHLEMCTRQCVMEAPQVWALSVRCLWV